MFSSFVFKLPRCLLTSKNSSVRYSELKPSRYDFEPKRRPTWFLIILTLGVGGLQGVFAVQFAAGSPYLATLGFSKRLMGLVWAAGPLSGAFGQAYFGICSDQSRCSWGKRRPYIATGSACIIISLLALAWTTEIAHFIARGLGYRESQTVIRNTTKVMATVCVYGLNLAIQPVQGGMRALFVDNCPTDQLDDASAWAARMTGIGNLLGYGSGFVNLPVILPILGDTQFKVLSVLSSCMLAVTISILCLSVQERDPSSDGHLDHRLSNLAGKFRHIFSGLTQMPPEIVKVCKVQFAAWSAWFVFLYYITTYIGHIYIKEKRIQQPPMSPELQLAVREDATRVGSLALLIFATVSLLAGICVPPLVSQENQKGKGSSSARSRFQFVPPSLRSIWLSSHLMFALCIASTLFVTTVKGTTIIVGVLGMCWGMTCWVPYALISTELSHLNTNRWQMDGITAIEVEEYETEPGIIIGLHNMAIAAPQLMSTIASSFIFWMWNQEDGGEDDSVGWVLRAGVISALVAAYLSSKLGKSGQF